ncbi:acyltransferase-like protein [Stackebrandtia albiflava]|uniref:Acyltransferase-like protein n=1 Tax=Stackebrandtia albiflava TaxID=406432 RepID=A0A562V9J7_9ACTN|nr:acyltransferase family protein [Stackebrandtia albiflava]TWJ14555.1 acyltransferase-like protein [Stackebrandtia albiflava]
MTATPPAGRDPGLDSLRALAVTGVVLGHWLVTAVVTDTGTLRAVSPLREMPELAPASWLFQTLAVFFLVGGAVATRRPTTPATGGHRRRLTRRLTTLAGPVALLLTVWAIVSAALLAVGVERETVRVLFKLAWSPLWFLAVFLLLVAAAPLLARVHPGWWFAAVAAADLVRFAVPGAEWVGWCNVVTGWLVPFGIGARWNRRGTPSRRESVTLLAGGAAAAVALVTWCGYPVSMVGVPGDGMSNLNPPSLAVVCFGVAQAGAAGLLLPGLRRTSGLPVVRHVVTALNWHAVPIFLWHQTAMISVTVIATTGAVALPGLHTPPDSPQWIAERLVWLPLFAIALTGYVLATRRRRRETVPPADPAPADTGRDLASV